MKKGTKYFAPDAEQHFVSVKSSVLTTSPESAEGENENFTETDLFGN